MAERVPITIEALPRLCASPGLQALGNHLNLNVVAQYDS